EPDPRDGADDRIVGVEALVRWDDPGRRGRSPAELAAVAAEAGPALTADLRAWVLGAACRQLARWLERLPPWTAMSVAVNVSARELDAGLVDAVQGALDATGVAPGRLELDITEAALAPG